MDDGSPGPRTTAGLALLQMLEGGGVWQAARYTVVASEIAAQSLTIAARRRFAGERAAVHDYAVRVLTGSDHSAQRAAICESLLTAVLTVGRTPEHVPYRHQDVVLILLRDLATGTDLAELLEAGERRLLRIMRKGIRWSPGNRRFRRERAAAGDTLAGVEPAPGTPMGRVLEALALFDSDRARELPADPDRRRAAAVVDGTFRALTGHCLGADPGPELVRGVASRAASRAVSVTVDAGLVAELITGGSGDVGREDRMGAQIVTVAELVEEYGLLPAELRRMITAAERRTP